MTSSDLIGKCVIVRTCSAGVHVGILAERDGKEVRLANARRLWFWRGANTLNEAATKGVAIEGTRLSDPVASIVVTEAIELIPVADAASPSLTQSRWA